MRGTTLELTIIKETIKKKPTKLLIEIRANNSVNHRQFCYN